MPPKSGASCKNDVFDLIPLICVIEHVFASPWPVKGRKLCSHIPWIRRCLSNVHATNTSPLSLISVEFGGLWKTMNYKSYYQWCIDNLNSKGRGDHAGLILNVSNFQVMFVLKLIFPSSPASLSQNQFHDVLEAWINISSRGLRLDACGPVVLAVWIAHLWD